MNAAQYRREHDRQKGQCTWCGGPVRPGRRTWCSGACVTKFKLRYDWQYIRSQVLDRDHGVCCRCGVDTAKILRIFEWVRRQDYGGWLDAISSYAAMGFKSVTRRDWWEADHIVARNDGGGDELANLRTLCIPCHKRRTAEQRREWAGERVGSGLAVRT